MEVRGIIGAARTIVDRSLRIGTERARADRGAGGQDRAGRHAILDPVHQSAEQVLRLRAHTAAAVPYTWRAEQAIEAVQRLEVRLGISLRLPRMVICVRRNSRSGKPSPDSSESRRAA